MSISDAQFAEWLLRDDRRACTLVEMDRVVETSGAPDVETLRMSNRPYAGDSLLWDDCVKSVPTYSRSLAGASLNSYQVSFGTLKLDNSDGALDWLLGAAADGSEVRFLYGDEAWAYADFRLIFACAVQKIEASALGELTVSLKDTSLLLNKSIGGEIKIGGDGPNSDRWRPVSFGYIHQAECIAWDDASLSYVFDEDGSTIINDGTFEQTVRDGGDPIDYVDNSDGSISLTAAPVFQITTDILAAPDGNPAHRCVSDALEYFIGERGGLNALSKYTGPGDTYSTRPGSGVEAWVDAGGEDYLIGVYVPERRNLIDLVNEITDSGNCFWACDRLGSIYLGRLRPFDPSVLSVTPRRAIVEDDIDIGTLRITHALPTYYKLQCRAARNWIITTQLADILTPEERDYLTRKGLEKIQDNFVGDSYDANPQLYHLSMAPSPTIDTLLSSGNGVDAIEIGRMDLWMDVRRGMTLPWIETVSLRTGLDRYDHELGDVVPIDFTRTDRQLFDPARNAQVIGIDIDLTAAKITLRLQLRRKPDVPAIEEPPEEFPDEDPQPPGANTAPLRQVVSLNPAPSVLVAGPTAGFAPLQLDVPTASPPISVTLYGKWCPIDPNTAANPFTDYAIGGPGIDVKEKWDAIAGDADVADMMCINIKYTNGAVAGKYIIKPVEAADDPGDPYPLGEYVDHSGICRLSATGVNGISINGAGLTLSAVDAFPTHIDGGDSENLAKSIVTGKTYSNDTVTEIMFDLDAYATVEIIAYTKISTSYPYLGTSSGGGSVSPQTLYDLLMFDTEGFNLKFEAASGYTLVGQDVAGDYRHFDQWGYEEGATDTFTSATMWDGSSPIVLDAATPPATVFFAPADSLTVAVHPDYDANMPMPIGGVKQRSFDTTATVAVTAGSVDPGEFTIEPNDSGTYDSFHLAISGVSAPYTGVELQITAQAVVDGLDYVNNYQPNVPVINISFV